MTTLRTLAATLIAGLAMMTASSAQPKKPQLAEKTPTIKKVPTGISKVQLNQRISTVLARQKAEMQVRLNEEERQIQSIINITSTERDKVSTALNADPRYKTFVDEAKRISNSKLSSDEKAEQLSALARQNQKLLNDAISKAKIDRNALQLKLQKTVPGIKLGPDFSVTKSTAKSSSSTIQALQSTPGMQEVVLLPPFTFEESESDNQGIAYSDATATPNADNGTAKAKVTVVGLAGAGSSTAEFGEFVSVPEGVKRMEVIIKLKNNYSGNALGAVGTSIASASISVSINNTGSSDGEQHDSEYKSDMAMAPVAWYSEMDGSQAGNYSFSFNVPNNAREYLISGYAHAYSIGAGFPGYASSNAKAEIDRITIRYHYQ
jgi:hypothetical protein